MAELPPELRNNDPEGFAWTVWHDRTPRLIAQIADAHPYSASQRGALHGLGEEIESGCIQPLPAGAPDAPQWESHLGERWLDAPFLWSESYFYRRLLEAVGYFAPGPWRNVDPFAYLKSAELHTTDTEASLAALARTEALPYHEQTQIKLLAALWGNRADLGYRIGREQAAAAVHADIVVDQTAELLDMLSEAAEVIVVTDNAGPELLADLVLADHLLAVPARAVRMHVKPHPYFVSDTTAADVVECADRLGRTAASQAAAVRLKGAAAAGRFTLQTHDFYCAPFGFDKMPADLAAQFASASVTLMKGDLNYRRLVGDRAWPPATPFAQAAGYFPGPVAALRVLKSDVLVGLPPGTDPEGPWRTDGTRGLVQIAA